MKIIVPEHLTLDKVLEYINLYCSIFSMEWFYHTAASAFNIFRRHLKSRYIKMVTVKFSCILHYKCVFIPKFNELSTFFYVVPLLSTLYCSVSEFHHLKFKPSKKRQHLCLNTCNHDFYWSASEFRQPSEVRDLP